MSTRILIAEDDTRLANLIKDYLTQQGYQVFWEANGSKVVAAVKNVNPDLIILDVMLPGRDGFELCRQLRPQYPGPILMFTARKHDVDQITGLSIGADDYVVKPVEPQVLVARIEALLRRFQPRDSMENSKALEFGRLKLNAKSRAARFADDEIKLTSHEFDLLWYLAQHAGDLVTRETIHFDVIGREYDGVDRTVDMRVSNIRKKMAEFTGRDDAIKTVWGRGYVFVADAWD
ncbi:response regulator transcription factor [Aliidiomarina haloalkalitolerans]|nr:response regulator transcription factor [Aliidiomarina haloalkalitolerans]